MASNAIDAAIRGAASRAEEGEPARSAAQHDERRILLFKRAIAFGG